MRKLFVVVLIALVVFAAAAEDEESHNPHHKKHHRRHHHRRHHRHHHRAPFNATADPSHPARVCDAGFVEVENGLCCPKDHPVLVDSTCYSHCGDGYDDLVIGSFVGCRQRCSGRHHHSTPNQCKKGKGPGHGEKDWARERTDTTRTGVAPVAQTSLSALPSTHVSTCRDGFVRVKTQGKGVFKFGGCCPEKHPQMIHGRCYAPCDAGFEALTMGRLVACRAHCPSTHTEDKNYCTRNKEKLRRIDYPRRSRSVKDRIVIPKPADTNAGCSDGWVVASKHYCCPTAQPNLKGLLCYETCKAGYLDSGFGCRKPCPDGWDQTVLQCAKGAQSVQREGYERHPKPSKLRI